MLAVLRALSARFVLQGGATVVMPIEALYDSLVLAQMVHHKRALRYEGIRRRLGVAPNGTQKSTHATAQAVTATSIVSDPGNSAWHR